MSIWTQVAGIIRVNSFRFDNTVDYKKQLLERLEQNDCFGKQFSFEDNWEDYDRENNPIPMGSEGSISYQIIENPHISSLDAFTIVITGSLRDYESITSVVNWFKKGCNQLNVRQGVISVECGFKNIIYDYNIQKQMEDF
ncbi:MAG: hypothetical protein ACOCRX_09895 [Candidatus Woesearchaeota archaeon]